MIKLRKGQSVDKPFLSHKMNALWDPLEILSVSLVRDCKQLHTRAFSEEQVGHRANKMAACTTE